MLKLIQDVRASYWFLPSVLVFVGLGLAVFMGWVDTHADALPVNLPTTFIDTQADGARSTLAVIAQSVIGVTGVTFSMTLVAVSFASGNFGPRLIGNFMRDRGNQWSLGILIATFSYALVVLRSVQDSSDGGAVQFVPQYSVILALALTIVCVFTLIYFIHHVPETINVSQISAGIGHALEKQIRDLIDENADDAAPLPFPETEPVSVVTSTRSGYIQTVNFTELESLTQDNDWWIEMVPPIGAFVTTRSDVFRIWAKAPLDDEEKDSVAACFALGTGRTGNQNPDFLAEQLVEMIARALSPGVNDPYTAIDCLNRIAAALTIAGCYGEGLRAPDLKKVRHPHVTFERLFAVTFPLCRQYVLPDDMVRGHAIGLLRDLRRQVRSEDQRLISEELERLSADKNSD